ncbi:MAG TPA: hypothetical protein VJ952_00270 [Opitutales bacterium]|nr:hypothetical protein [Opitutales bacterium]
MWLATKHGFYSIVEKTPTKFHIRARVRQDLDNLRQLTGSDWEILEWPLADYRFRVIVDRKGFVEVMGALALSLDYPNFKAQIANTPDQRTKLEAFHRIWALLAQLPS